MIRHNLSQEIAERLRDRIAAGTLPAGARINESALSEELEVSRTPLREALSRLASDGFVTARPRRGFFVQTLGPEAVRELYEIRGILDPSALELAGVPPERGLSRLAELNRRIGDSGGDPRRTVELDEAWHRELLAHCPNRIVLDLIETFMLRTRPFERAYMAERANVETVVEEHEKIRAALAAGDLAGAVEALRANMSSAIPVLVAWAAEGAGDADPEEEGG